jgi:hypothetical protein
MSAAAPPAQATAPRTQPAPTPAVVTGSAPGPFPTVSLRRHGAPIRVAGPVTGRLYAFTEAEAIQAVDLRDAAVLARSPSFQQL